VTSVLELCVFVTLFLETSLHFELFTIPHPTTSCLHIQLYSLSITTASPQWNPLVTET
jgi:hypothetical protein